MKVLSSTSGCCKPIWLTFFHGTQKKKFRKLSCLLISMPLKWIGIGAFKILNNYFAFMHLVDIFIQSNLHWIQGTCLLVPQKRKGHTGLEHWGWVNEDHFYFWPNYLFNKWTQQVQVLQIIAINGKFHLSRAKVY